MKKWLIAAALTLCAGFAFAQDGGYPSKPIHFIMPFPAGTTIDVMARLVTSRMAEELGQPIVVENRVGASGLIGIRQLVASRPDGYTLALSGNTTHAAAMSLFKHPGYDPLKDFDHIGLIVYLPWVLVVSTSIPATNIAEFVSYVRAHPGKLSTSYYSGSSRISLAKLRASARLDVVEVPYNSAAQILADMRNGQIAFAFLTPDVAAAQAKTGVMRLLGVSTPERLANLPDVPAIAEVLPNFEQMVSWAGIVAPASTPKEVVAKLQASLAKVLAEPDTRRRLRDLGGEAAPVGPDEIAVKIKNEVVQWAQFVSEAEIDPQ
jgi:tripartite-type tricarboxylate transporter receptor subunit TctC